MENETKPSGMNMAPETDREYMKKVREGRGS